MAYKMIQVGTGGFLTQTIERRGNNQCTEQCNWDVGVGAAIN